MTNGNERNVKAAIALFARVHNQATRIYELLINSRHPC